jgi:hypothetical protein
VVYRQHVSFGRKEIKTVIIQWPICTNNTNYWLFSSGWIYVLIVWVRVDLQRRTHSTQVRIKRRTHSTQVRIKRRTHSTQVRIKRRIHSTQVRIKRRTHSTQVRIKRRTHSTQVRIKRKLQIQKRLSIYRVWQAKVGNKGFY